MNISPIAENKAGAASIRGVSELGESGAFPEFLLSAVQGCTVELVTNPAAATQPSKTRAELLADGQCEV